MHSHHDHHHHHTDFASGAHRWLFIIGIILNFGFVIVEALYGWMSGSLALIADAGHNLSDVLSLVIAFAAVLMAKARPTPYFTYGLRRSSILSAFINSVLLLLVIGGIAWEAVSRFMNPAPVQTGMMIVVASIGIVINTLTALLFLRDRHHDLNVKAAFIHMAGDALVSLGVVIGALMIQWTGLLWIDPLLSLLICIFIVATTWGVLRDSTRLAMDAVPNSVDPEAVQKYLSTLQGVESVHDLHIWGMSTTETALTAHLVLPKNLHSDEFLDRLAKDLAARFKIHHATIQLETSAMHAACNLKV